MLGFEKNIFWTILWYETARDSSGDERPERNIAVFCHRSCILRPDRGFSLGTIFVKFCTEGQRTAKIQNDEEILPKISTTAWAGCTNVADDRRICDSEDPKVQTHAVYGTAYSEYSSDNTVIMLILYRCVELNWGLKGRAKLCAKPPCLTLESPLKHNWNTLLTGAVNISRIESSSKMICLNHNS